MSTEKMETKEDIKKVIDKSTDYGELYKNAIDVLQKMESTFRQALLKIANNEWRDSKKKSMIKKTVFDDWLNTSDPITIFEKKWAELLRRWEDIAEKNKVLNAWIQLYKKLWWERLSQEWKNLIAEELFQTRLWAIQNFKNDISDGILSNKNNVEFDTVIIMWRSFWSNLFREKESDKNGFEQQVNTMTLPQLIYWTFNIEEGSWAFTYCYWKLKDRLWNQGLFDYIDSLGKRWDQISDVLKYSSLKMLFSRKKVEDLNKWIESYRWNKQGLLNYIKTMIIKDESFKMSFLTSIREVENLPLFKSITNDLKNSDQNVKKAYENASNFDNIDIFKSWKVDALTIYDDAWHWWWWAFFQSELTWYKNQWFWVIATENNSNYTKYVLKKWSDTITMIQLKIEANSLDISDIQNSLSLSVNATNYNLFALRGHCYNTDKFACALWWLNAVKEDDILIDGWCWNASKTGEYYKSWVKWQIFAYTSEWRWASTQAFINRIIAAKSSWKNFSEILAYYNWVESESWVDGYFAFNVERPDSIPSKYKLLTS